MSKSVKRVEQAAQALGLDIEVKRMGASTRTAEDAAAACGCTTAQIVKSLIFAEDEGDRLALFLVPGDRRVDIVKAATACGMSLTRADPIAVRARTGFAIGGVSPIGHLEAPLVLMDHLVLDHNTVWAAAGAPDAVFAIDPKRLSEVIDARLADLTEPA